MKTLGLDLGSNSLGWAILDDSTGNILNKGVVIFPDGIDPAKDSLETPAATRRKNGPKAQVPPKNPQMASSQNPH